MTTAKDIMQTEVVTVGFEDSLSSVYRSFAGAKISVAPVVDELGTIAGVVSFRDLMRVTREDQESSFVDSNYFRDGFSDSEGDCLRGVEYFEETLSQRMVSEVIGVRRFLSSRTLRECWHLPEEPTRARHPLGDALDGLSAKSDSDTSCPALAAPDRL